MAPPSENTSTVVYSHCTNRFEHHTVAIFSLDDCVQHVILQKFTNFHALGSWSFQNICNEIGWPRFLRHPVYDICILSYVNFTHDCCFILFYSDSFFFVLLLYSRFLASFHCISIPSFLQLLTWVLTFVRSCSICNLLIPLTGLPFTLHSKLRRRVYWTQNTKHFIILFFSSRFSLLVNSSSGMGLLFSPSQFYIAYIFFIISILDTWL